MKTTIRLLVIGLFIAACIGSETLGANFRVPAADGWYTWQVEAADGSDLEVFAQMQGGKPVKFRVRSNAICYSGFRVEAADLGRIDADQSVAWLQHYVRPASDLSTEALVAIALHSGNLPDEILDQLLSS